MKKGLREKATQLRKWGWSYNVISTRLGVSKSSLSDWLKEIPYTPNQEVRKRIREGPLKTVILKHRQRLESIRNAKELAMQEFGTLSKRDLFMLGMGLYIGEGAKLYESVRIINSDPRVIQLAIKWFREICGLDIKNFSLAIHMYPDTPQKKTLEFWTKLTGVPLSQFGKTQIDKRLNKSNKKQRKLPYGTAHITIKSCGLSKHGVFLHRKIIGWIEAAYQNL